MTARDDVAELLDVLCGMACGIGIEIGGAEDGVDPGLGIHHRRACGGREAGLCVAQRMVLLVVLGRGFKPFASRLDHALDVVVDILHGLAERCDHRLVGVKFNDLAELFEGDRLGFLDLAGALVQSLFAARSHQRRSLTGKARALGRKLQAGGKTGNVPCAEVEHGVAEMPEHHAGAGADQYRHTGDNGEGGKQAAPHPPLRTQQAGPGALALGRS